MKILDDPQKSARTADDVLAIPFGQAARRLGVERIARVRLIVDDGEPVDRHPLPHRLVTRIGDRPAGIVGAVAGDVDNVPVGARLRGRKALHRKIDRAADRGAPDERARRCEDRRRKPTGILLVADHRPVGDDVLLPGARPLDKADRDCAGSPAADRREHARVGQCGRVALALQCELALVDAARHIGGEHEQQIGGLRAHAPGEGQQSSEEDRSRHSRSHRKPSPSKAEDRPTGSAVEGCRRIRAATPHLPLGDYR